MGTVFLSVPVFYANGLARRLSRLENIQLDSNDDAFLQRELAGLIHNLEKRKWRFWHETCLVMGYFLVLLSLVFSFWA